MGKIIYKPDGKAGEYSEYAANLYVGCSNCCSYCYNRIGQRASLLGKDVATLKKTLINEQKAFEIFKKELIQQKAEILASGSKLHCSFVSDPCLEATIDLSWKCIEHALDEGVPVQTLTKMANWIDHPAVQKSLKCPLLSVGFTLTGVDYLESGASKNSERVEALKTLHDQGVGTWCSIEPIIDPDLSLEMIEAVAEYADYLKIGLLSGQHKNYTSGKIRELKEKVDALGLNVYWKKDLLEFIKTMPSS